MRLLWSLLCVIPLASSARRDDVPVEYRTFQVSPDTIRVSAGGTVRWTNRDQIEHTVTGGSPEQRIAAWHSVLGTAGSTASRTFTHAGTFSYFCDRHRFMRGTVVVTPNPQE